MSETKQIYKVIFYNQGELYEIYARQVSQGNLYGFVEIEQLVFGEKTSLVVDPSEERLKSEFSDVKRTYIPMHAVVRIDEVEKEILKWELEANIDLTSNLIFTKMDDAGMKRYRDFFMMQFSRDEAFEIFDNYENKNDLMKFCQEILS